MLFDYGELSPMKEIPCLTLHAHWAAAIFQLGKDIENRTWATDYRGPLAIHAGRTIDPAICIALGLDPETVTRRAILGTVELVDVVRGSRSRWAVRGQYHWVLRNPKPFVTPKPHSGKQGLHPVTL